MNFEEQLLIGGLLMTIAVLSASHAHARPAAARTVHTEMTISASGQHGDLIRPENRNAIPVHAAP